jgi:hypothetical protein
MFRFLASHPKSIRYFSTWLKHYIQKKKYNTINLGLPWMNFEVTDWLQKNITSQMLIFEWGSGGSTLFYAKKAKQVISIEYDKGFYDYIKTQFVSSGSNNIDLRYVPSEKSGQFQSFAPGYQGQYFDNYVNIINEFEPGTFDVIIVDGRQRNACFEKAIAMVKSGGFIVFDNSEREFYKKSINKAVGFELITFKGLLPCSLKIGTTSVFIKN